MASLCYRSAVGGRAFRWDGVLRWIGVWDRPKDGSAVRTPQLNPQVKPSVNTSTEYSNWSIVSRVTPS